MTQKTLTKSKRQNMMTHNRIPQLLLLLLLLLAGSKGVLHAQCPHHSSSYRYSHEALPKVTEARLDSLEQITEDKVTFIIASDMNRFGQFNQRENGYRMGYVADAVDAEFVAVTGDLFHYLGVQGIADHLFISCFEEMYTHPELQIPWHVIAGNHEYKGSTQALVDYSSVSRRWDTPALYYQKSIRQDGVSADLFFIDTPPLIDKYRNNPEEYPDAVKHSREAQLAWLEKALSESDAEHKIVLGHHPVFAQTTKEESEREDMQKYIDPLLRKYNVDYYFSGHIHNYQAIHRADSPCRYLTITSLASTRKATPIEGTKYCSDEQGFAVVTMTPTEITVLFLDGEGRILYQETK